MDTQQLLEAVETLKVIKSLFAEPRSEWLPVAAAVGGAFVGGISTIIPNYLIERKRSHDERVRVTSALIAEVHALLTIIERRRYLQEIQELAERLRGRPDETARYEVKVSVYYSRVYQSHVSRLGRVDPELAAKIIEFHQLMDSVIQDIEPGGLIAKSGGSAETFDQLIALLKSAYSIGYEITGNELDRA